MRKIAFGLLLATGVMLAAPANAQGVWVGAGPFGVGVGTDTYAYGYAPGPYWGAPNPPYNPYFVYGGLGPTYAYAPGWTYAAPTYDAAYAYVPDYDYGYTTAYTYEPSTTYAYVPARSYRRTVIRTSNRDRLIVHRSNRYLASDALNAQASVPVRHVRHHAIIRKERD
jgi:hypothetical protein